MKHFAIIISYIVVAIVLLSCNNKDKKGSNENVNYSLKSEGIAVTWTAYKFTERVGVKGVFENFKFKTKYDSSTIDNLLKDSKISIETASVNSNLEIRDAKLRDIFFNTLNTKTINSHVLKANSDKGTVVINMNNTSKHVDFNYRLKTDTLYMKMNLDLIQWKAQKALDTLNKVCYDLHKGADGISKLWPDVSIEVKIPIVQVEN